MAYVIRKLLDVSTRIIGKPSVFRNFSISKSVHENYEGDGKTTVTILNREHKDLIMFDTFSNKGFRLNNGIFIIGPVAVFPRTILQWNVESFEKLTSECFTLFSVLEPKLDIFIFGTGDKRVLPNAEVLAFLKEHKLSTEILPTEQACATFNFLNAEGRYVAGALLPPENLTVYEDELKLVSEGDTHISPFQN